MSARACPVPHCTNPLPAGPHAVFCAEHHCMLPSRVTREIFALKISCARTDAEDTQLHLREQIAARVRIAVESLTEGRHVA